MIAPSSAAQEWRQHWVLPLVAALGYSTAVLSTYGLGPFVEPLEHEFGWSRASISFGLTIVGFSGAALGIPVGLLVDRFGPRRVGLTGAVLMPAAIALLGTATGSLANWFVLWSIVACANFWLQATVWTSAVSSRFELSRGLALAVTLSGGSLTSALLPLIATAVIVSYDWRTAYMAVGGIWFAMAFPLIFLFFRGAQDRDGKKQAIAKSDAPQLPGVSVAEALRMAAFYQLVAASGLFAFAGVGVLVHFVPILTDRGATPMGAAGVASLIGVFSIAGRLGTGLLLDRLPARAVGSVVFLMPVVACFLLLFDGANTLYQMVSAAFFGITLGAEVDVIAYLAVKHFGLRNYGVLFGSMSAALATGTALGPLAAGAAFDAYRGYSQFLGLTAILMVIGSLAVATLGTAKDQSPEGLRNSP